MKLLYFGVLLLFFMVLMGCKTYYISTPSLLEQFENAGTQQKGIVFIAPPFFFPGSVEGNALQSIHCADGDGKEYFLRVDGRMSVRITTKDSTRRTFYFDTLLIKDSTITGSKTHFFEWRIKPVKLDDIVSIEIQKS